MLYVGIDPGLSGAIAFLDDGKRPRLDIYDMPTVSISKGKREIDTPRLEGIFDSYLPDLIVIEEVGTVPAWGAASSFTFGKCFASALAVAQLRPSRPPILRPGPKVWKRALLEGTDKSKEAAIAKVRGLYPHALLTRPDDDKPSHDRAEAVLLALYGRQHA